MVRDRAAFALALALAALALGACRKRGDDHKADGVRAGAAHACALMRDGTVKCWGNALGTTGGPSPAPFGGRWHFVELAVGAAHTCGIAKADPNERARVLCWGANERGQVGETPSTAEKYAKILEIDAKEIYAGGKSTCARDAAGAVTCWGAA